MGFQALGSCRFVKFGAVARVASLGFKKFVGIIHGDRRLSSFSFSQWHHMAVKLLESQ